MMMIMENKPYNSENEERPSFSLLHGCSLQYASMEKIPITKPHNKRKRHPIKVSNGKKFVIPQKIKKTAITKNA
jgi:hypothetical protein